jgi:hypothetical protein
MKVIRISLASYGLLLIGASVILFATLIVSQSAVGQNTGSPDRVVYPMLNAQEAVLQTQPARSPPNQPRHKAPSSAAEAVITCQMSRGDGGHWAWRLIEGRKCWYRGDRGLSRSRLRWASRDEPSLSKDRRAPSPPRRPSTQVWRSLSVGLSRADDDRVTGLSSEQQQPRQRPPATADPNFDPAAASRNSARRPSVTEPSKSWEPASSALPKPSRITSDEHSIAAADGRPSRLSDGGRIAVIAVISAIALMLAAIAGTIVSSGVQGTKRSSG